MLKLTVLGADSVLAADTCAACPHSPAGCCVAPPRYDWTDLGRVVAHGGHAWLLEQIRAGALRRVEHGYAIRRDKTRLSADRGAPRLAKCTFHAGDRGCTIETWQRPATCNFYLCESALEDAVREGQHAEAARAKHVHDALVSWFVAADRAIADEARARVLGSTPAQSEAAGSLLARVLGSTRAPRSAAGSLLAQEDVSELLRWLGQRFAERAQPTD